MSLPACAIERRSTGQPADASADADLAEAYILAMFWTMARATEDRLGLLLIFTKFTIRRPDTWDAAAIRRAHETNDPNAVVRLTRSECLGCGATEDALYRHHVIEIQHGGSNAVRNQVALCFECHRYLHPWLKRPEKRRGFVSVRELAPASLRTMARGEERR